MRSIWNRCCRSSNRSSKRLVMRPDRVKFLLPILTCCLVLFLSSCPAHAQMVTNLRVMSFNIWVNGGTSLPGCINAIRTSGADIVGLQECNATTARIIATNLGFYYLGVTDV